MKINTTTIPVVYSDAMLRILVEEYITMQRREFSFRGVCDYVLYRNMEEGCTAGQTIYASNELQPSDRERIRRILTRISDEGRIAASADKLKFTKA